MAKKPKEGEANAANAEEEARVLDDVADGPESAENGQDDAEEALTGNLQEADAVDPDAVSDGKNDTAAAQNAEDGAVGEDHIDPGNEVDANETAIADDETLRHAAEDTTTGDGTEYSAASDGQSYDWEDTVEPSVGDRDLETGSPAGVVPVATAETPTQPQPPQSRSGGILPMLIGGVLAGAIGFAAGAFLMPAMTADGVAESPPGIDEAMESRLEGIEEGLAALGDSVAGITAFDSTEIEARQGELASQADEIAAASDAALADLGEVIAEMQARIEELEARPIFEAGDTEAAMAEQRAEFERIVAEAGAAAREELESLRAEAEAMRAEAEAMQEEALAATRAADRRAAIGEISAAIDSGAPFDEPLAALGEDVPQGLTENAETGVPTMTELRQTFPEHARDALAAAPAESESADDGLGRVAAFLRRQTNARSLAPRDGNDTDAILSRAEKAVNDGDLEAALEELQALPEPAAQTMQPWTDEAARRLAAEEAARTLSNEG